VAKVSADPRSTRAVDPRAVRVALAPASAAVELSPIVLEPAAIPVVPARRSSFAGATDVIHPGPNVQSVELGSEPGVPSGLVIIDGVPVSVRLERRDTAHAVLVDDDHDTERVAVVMLPAESSASGTVSREVIVDGWRIVVEIESEQRATLRERARRGRDETARSGRTELRAVIPGRILAVLIAPGDSVTAGQQIMVVEARKMQNELRAPRDGVVGRVEVGPGRTVEVGDLLLVLE
jgi:biotin carboxyl carrier protein